MNSSESKLNGRKNRLTEFSGVSEISAQNYPEAPEEMPFPVECLPEAAREMIAEVARVSHAERNLVAVQSLGWMAATLGKGSISVLGATRTFPNLFILGVSGTGSGKSESARHLGKPFYELRDAELQLWRETIKPRAEARNKEIKLKMKALESRAKKGDGEFGPEDRKQMEELLAEQVELAGQLTAPRFIIEDATQEALADALSSHDESLFSHSTDAGKVISNLLGRYASTTQGGVLREDTAFLKGYSVESLVIDRVLRGSIVLSEPCITLLWLIQPGKIELLFGDAGLCDGGFMPRMMPCLTSGGLPERSFQEPIDWRVLQKWARLITKLFVIRKSGGAVKSSSRVEFQVSEDAARGWFDWDNANRKKTNLGDFRDVAGFVARWGEWAQRIAVNLHAAKFIEDSENRTITWQTMQDAIQIAEWFKNEQLRILHSARLAAAEVEVERSKDRAKNLEGILRVSGGERPLADLGRRNGFKAKEVRELAERFPQKFEVLEKQTNTKPSTVCVLK